MNPLMEQLAAASATERERTNFAFVERAVTKGSEDSRHVQILYARDHHGPGWTEAVHFSNGVYAARAGWAYTPPVAGSSVDPGSPLRAAYDLGFAAGGGKPDDLFDAARRALHAADNAARVPVRHSGAKPAPSQWPSPNDAPRPTRWAKRLLIIGASHPQRRDFIAALHSAAGGDTATVLLLDAEKGYARLRATEDDIDGAERWSPLHSLTAGLELENILVAVDGAELATIDADAAALPLCRTMERTRNSALQQRQQYKTWLSRGLGVGETRASGHIRWGKAIQGLTGKLGEFTARYGGPAPPRGHRILIEHSSGTPAIGFATVDGVPLDPEWIISNRARLRAEMAAMLRAFAAALPMTAAAGRSSSGRKG